MNTLKNLLSVKCGSAVSTGLCFVLIAIAILVSPEINPWQNVQAAIDETMPDSIPAEVIADWKDQDQVQISGSNYSGAIETIVGKLPAEYAEKYNAAKAGEAGLSGEKLYLLACHYRRVARMKKYEADLENIMFARHHNFGGIVVGYHDNSDAGNADQAWESKGALCVLNMKNYYSTFTEIYARSDAVVRDPCISFDGKKVLFAISGKGKGTGYKIYEMEIANTSTLTQLTFDPESLSNVADFEPCYLPNGNIMFTSTRNFVMIAHSYQPVTNMFLMNGQGKYIRQVGFDQAHTFYPVLMDDGQVLYTRWEFNDRDLTNSMGLFMMYPDGSHQTEWFGNQTPWPMTMIHGRPIPGTNNAKVMCVAGGHHGPYAGELMMIDRNYGVDGKEPITMIAPLRETKPDVNKSDMGMGNVNFLFQTPYPLDDKNFLVSWRKSESESKYRLFFMNVDGTRELLAWADQSVSQPVSIKPREVPPKIAVQSNWKDSVGSFLITNVYIGEGMKTIDKASGAAKSLRVVALHYRAAGAPTGSTMGSGPSGVFTPAIFCPVSQYGASWDAKEVLGETKIYPDGSASFKVPARTPVYFQVLDSMGYCIATMRSWATLMPGEKFACTGCHESKLSSTIPFGSAQAGAPKPLDTPLGIENKPFDYKQMVQPIFDSKCVSCHTATHESGFDLSGDTINNAGAKKTWTKSYNSLLKGIPVKTSNNAINICTIFSQPEQQPPYSFGSSLSGIMTKGGISGSHHDVQVTETERKIVACWIDLCAPYASKYNSYMSKSDSTAYEKKLDKRVKWTAIEKENIKAMLAEGGIPDGLGSVKSSRSLTEQLGIGYVPTKRALVLKKISKGNLRVLDLRGRVMYCIKLSNQHTKGDVTISLPAQLGRGLYFARFEGVNGIRQAKILITK